MKPGDPGLLHLILFSDAVKRTWALIWLIVIPSVVWAQSDRPKPLPEISLNIAYLQGFTDLGLSSSGPSPISQLGYQLHITQQVIPYMNVTFSLFTGKVRGDETIGNQNINFSSSIFSQTLGVEYNFRPMLKTNSEGRQLIRPFIGIAFGVMQFRAKSDLKDAQGRTYNYWSDGKIYNQAEGQSDPDLLVELQRDYEYETDLRDQNNDGLGKYSQIAFTMPINAGVRFQIGRNVGANVHVGYMLNFTDMVDDMSEASIGIRAGTGGNDNSLFASLGLTVFMGRTKPLPRPTPTPAPLVQAESKDTASVAKAETAEPKKEATSEGAIENRQTEFASTPAAVPVSFEEALRQQEERNRRLLDAMLSGRPVNAQNDVSISEIESASKGVSDSGLPISTDDQSHRPKEPANQDNPLAGSLSASANASEGAKSETTQEKTGGDLVNGASQTATAASGAMKDDTPSQPVSNAGSIQAAPGANVVSQNNASVSIQTENSGGTITQQGAVTGTQASADAGKNTHTPEREAMRIEAEKVGAKDVSVFHWADRDKSGKITPDEVLFYIDQLFEGSGELSVGEIQDLIDYYFEQP